MYMMVLLSLSDGDFVEHTSLKVSLPGRLCQEHDFPESKEVPIWGTELVFSKQLIDARLTMDP